MATSVNPIQTNHRLQTRHDTVTDWSCIVSSNRGEWANMEHWRTGVTWNMSVQYRQNKEALSRQERDMQLV